MIDTSFSTHTSAFGELLPSLLTRLHYFIQVGLIAPLGNGMRPFMGSATGKHALVSKVLRTP